MLQNLGWNWWKLKFKAKNENLRLSQERRVVKNTEYVNTEPRR